MVEMSGGAGSMVWYSIPSASTASSFHMQPVTATDSTSAGWGTLLPATATLTTTQYFQWPDSGTQTVQWTRYPGEVRLRGVWDADGQYVLEAGYALASGSYESPTAAERLKEIMAGRSAPAFLHRSRPLPHAPDARECRARETLRRVVGEEKYRGFLRRGFLTVRARSGKVYTLHPGHRFTNVYLNGVMLERLCVVLRGDWPDTDSVIARYLLLLNNEGQFRTLANVHPAVRPAPAPGAAPPRTLAEIFAALAG